MSDGSFLTLVQVFHTVLYAPEIHHIGKQGLRLDQIFVHVVKVSKQHISPEDEVVQTLASRIQLLVAVIKQQQLLDSVSLAQTAQAEEELIHSGDFRREQGLSGLGGRLCEILAEEGTGTFVGEDETQFVHLPKGEVMTCSLFQERNHPWTILLRGT